MTIYKSTFAFDVNVIGQAAEKIGTNVLPKNPVKITVAEDGTTSGLPPQTPGVKLVVNAPVYRANPLRNDLCQFNPDLAERDADGKVTAQGGLIER